MKSDLDQLKQVIEDFPLLVERVERLEETIQSNKVPVSIKEYADTMGVHRSTVSRGMDSGTIEFIWVGSRRRPLIVRGFKD